jgi:hypothetical protein
VINGLSCVFQGNLLIWGRLINIPVLKDFLEIFYFVAGVIPIHRYDENLKKRQ